jgi:hypothetical protein
VPEGRGSSTQAAAGFLEFIVHRRGLSVFVHLIGLCPAIAQREERRLPDDPRQSNGQDKMPAIRRVWVLIMEWVERLEVKARRNPDRLLVVVEVEGGGRESKVPEREAYEQSA